MLDPTQFTWTDTNGDGIADSGLLDTNGDGYAETVATDSNQDGVIDAIGLDADGNGVFENVWIDPAGTGAFNVMGIDIDQNGTLDQLNLPDGQMVSIGDGVDIAAVLANNTYVGGGGTNALLGGPASAYQDPYTIGMINNILANEARTAGIQALPDGWGYAGGY